jgi:hypothetical protein
MTGRFEGRIDGTIPAIKLNRRHQGHHKILSYKVATDDPFFRPIASYIATVMRYLSNPNRNSTRPRVSTLKVWVLASLLVPGIASATLGEDGATVQRDAVGLRAQRLIAQSGAFSVHELQLPGGTRVREYLTAGQQIFAITWSGPSIPDLQQLLGTYFPRYQQGAARTQGRGRQPIMLHEPDLVIQTGGHPRAFSGVVYLPGLMPPGVSADQIQ